MMKRKKFTQQKKFVAPRADRPKEERAKEFDASRLDIAVNGLPKFDHYCSTYLALDMGPLPAASARFVHQTIKGVPDPGQDSNGIGCINVLANARQVDGEMLYEIVS